MQFFVNARHLRITAKMLLENCAGPSQKKLKILAEMLEWLIIILIANESRSHFMKVLTRTFATAMGSPKARSRRPYRLAQSAGRTCTPITTARLNVENASARLSMPSRNSRPRNRPTAIRSLPSQTSLAPPDMFLWRALKPKDIVAAVFAVKSGTRNKHEPGPMFSRAHKASNVKVVAKPATAGKLVKSDL
jgi:hypothetical protein